VALARWRSSGRNRGRRHLHGLLRRSQPGVRRPCEFGACHDPDWACAVRRSAGYGALFSDLGSMGSACWAMGRLSARCLSMECQPAWFDRLRGTANQRPPHLLGFVQIAGRRWARPPCERALSSSNSAEAPDGRATRSWCSDDPLPATIAPCLRRPACRCRSCRCTCPPRMSRAQYPGAPGGPQSPMSCGLPSLRGLRLLHPQIPNGSVPPGPTSWAFPCKSEHRHHNRRAAPTKCLSVMLAFGAFVARQLWEPLAIAIGDCARAGRPLGLPQAIAKIAAFSQTQGTEPALFAIPSEEIRRPSPGSASPAIYPPGPTPFCCCDPRDLVPSGPKHPGGSHALTPVPRAMSGMAGGQLAWPA